MSEDDNTQTTREIFDWTSEKWIEVPLDDFRIGTRPCLRSRHAPTAPVDDPEVGVLLCDNRPVDLAIEVLRLRAALKKTTKDKPPYMQPEKFRPMPAEAAELLNLADHLCGWACEISNQREPAEPWPKGDGTSIPFERAPTWTFEELSKALNAYYEARHLPQGDQTTTTEYDPGWTCGFPDCGCPGDQLSPCPKGEA